ncbi:MAG TPA: class I SAM-dependent methyltransferase [Polyangiaceae bacterium]
MTQSDTYSYVGEELELFSDAANWKAYWSRRLRPYVRGDVLDVGAGLGATFDYLAEAADTWTCLEPDAELCARLAERLDRHPLPPRVECGTLAKLDPVERFDAVLYIDVLEHIEDDRAELERAGRALRSGGHLIVLSPALPGLFSEFDRRVGHFRRYTRASLLDLAPPGLVPERWFFLDGIGVVASIFARMSGRGSPTPAQIRLWDRVMVPFSRVTDLATCRLFGRSIVAIWTKRDPATTSAGGRLR